MRKLIVFMIILVLIGFHVLSSSAPMAEGQSAAPQPSTAGLEIRVTPSLQVLERGGEKKCFRVEIISTGYEGNVGDLGVETGEWPGALRAGAERRFPGSKADVIGLLSYSETKIEKFGRLEFTLWLYAYPPQNDGHDPYGVFKLYYRVYTGGVWISKPDGSNELKNATFWRSNPFFIAIVPPGTYTTTMTGAILETSTYVTHRYSTVTRTYALGPTERVTTTATIWSASTATTTVTSLTTVTATVPELSAVGLPILTASLMAVAVLGGRFLKKGK